ncbi:hypothetical protein ACFYRN_35450 [Streptomyces sp. NPDC005227]|uniref:hypothetical protein n=1 Tax=Streptomyces sp. NPDC005227 TaxID=3364707 RepID=UPI00369899DA
MNAVAPGPTRTRMTEGIPEEMVNQLAGLAPAGRVAEPEKLLPRSSSWPARMPASSMASPFPSMGAEYRPDAGRGL